MEQSYLAIRGHISARLCCELLIVRAFSIHIPQIVLFTFWCQPCQHWVILIVISVHAITTSGLQVVNGCQKVLDYRKMLTVLVVRVGFAWRQPRLPHPSALAKPRLTSSLLAKSSSSVSDIVHSPSPLVQIPFPGTFCLDQNSILKVLNAPTLTCGLWI